GHGPAGRLVLEAHRHHDVVAFLDLRFHRFEHVIAGAAEHRTGQAHEHRNSTAGRENFPSHFRAPRGWTIGDATILGPHGRTRSARALGSRVAAHLQADVRREEVEKADWPSANRTACSQTAAPFHRSQTGLLLLKTIPRKNWNTWRCSRRITGILSSRGRTASRRGDNSRGQTRPADPTPMHRDRRPGGP